MIVENDLVFPDEAKPHALGALVALRTKVLRGTQVGMAPRWLGELLFNDLATAMQAGVLPSARSRFDLTEIRFRDLLEKDGRTSDSDNSTWNAAYKQVDDALRTIANRLDQADSDRGPAPRNGKQTAFGSAAETFHGDGVTWLLRVSGPLHESNSDDKRANIRLVLQVIEVLPVQDAPNAPGPASRSVRPHDSSPERPRYPSPPPPQFHLLWLALLLETLLGMAISLAYGLVGAGLLYAIHGQSEAFQFLKMYVGLFGTLVSLGLAIATALTVARYEHVVPLSIEAAFSNDELPEGYFKKRSSFRSRWSTAIFAGELGVLGFAISSLSRFPLRGLAEALMMQAAFFQWVLIAYVIRKLCYAVMMLSSVVSLTAHEDVFRKRQLDFINSFVRLVATLSVIFLYVLVRSYYYAPFLYDSAIGISARVFLLAPPAAATAVFLVFNFMPRETLRQIYENALDALIAQRPVSNESHIALENRLRDDLRRSSKPGLADLPIALAALTTLLEFIVYR
jgi:hypothetical protein